MLKEEELCQVGQHASLSCKVSFTHSLGVRKRRQAGTLTL